MTRRILVAGGGITALLAAAALKRHAPFLEVTLLATPPAPDALADRIACTLPSLPGFHADLGIGEGDGVARIGAGYRLGTAFSGWAEGLPDYVHAYGRYGVPVGATSFHHHWLRQQASDTAKAFDALAPSAVLARADRFAPAAEPPFADYEYGLTLDLPRYVAMIQAFTRHVGVIEIEGAIGDVSIGSDGMIAEISLTDRQALSADLYIDATGPAAALRDAIDGERDDWRRWLPCDRVILADEPGKAPRVLTSVTAHQAGWHWTSGGQSGFAYASSQLTDSRAAGVLQNAAAARPREPLVVRAGTRPAPWRGNCIAIGDAATEIEPLEWSNLHLALSAIDRLVTMLPAGAPSPVEAADFNRQARAEAERVRDFLVMHWYVARRADPLWRDIAATEPPPSLAHTLTQWTERGRLPFYEEETFARDSWVAVLIGQGCLPRRIDPLVEAIPVREAQRAMAALSADIAAALPAIPHHAAYLAAQARHYSA